MAKKILFPLIAMFLAYRSYEILKSIWLVEPTDFTLSIKILLSVLLNLFITGIFAFFGFAYDTNRLLPKNYYRVKNPKFVIKISGFLKMEVFKKFLLLIFWGKRKNREKYFDGTRSGLDNFKFQTRQSEFGHFGSLVVIQIAVILMLIKGHYTMAALTTILNFIFNFYPVLLQRNHRIQIERIRNILNRRIKKLHFSVVKNENSKGI